MTWLTVSSYLVGVVYEQSTGGQPDVDHGRLAQPTDVSGPRTAFQLAWIRRAVLLRSRHNDEPRQEVWGVVSERSTMLRDHRATTCTRCLWTVRGVDRCPPDRPRRVALYRQIGCCWSGQGFACIALWTGGSLLLYGIHTMIKPGVYRAGGGG